MKHYIWAILWALVILVLCSLPSATTDSIPKFPGIDKLVHTGFFFVFTILMFFGSIMNSKEPTFFHWPSVLILITASLFAFLTELIQKYFFSYRSFEYWDIFADHVGIGMGYFAYLVLVLSISKIKD